MTFDAQIVIWTHLCVTLYLTGLIWFVQIVHYPLFQRVGGSEFVGYHSAHTALTGRVVILPMTIELLTAIYLAAFPPAGARMICWLGLMLVLAIWLSTAALQVPAHRLLAERKRSEVIRRLVLSNWIRTIAWSIRAALALLLFR